MILGVAQKPRNSRGNPSLAVTSSRKCNLLNQIGARNISHIALARNATLHRSPTLTTTQRNEGTQCKGGDSQQPGDYQSASSSMQLPRDEAGTGWPRSKHMHNFFSSLPRRKTQCRRRPTCRPASKTPKHCLAQTPSASQAACGRATDELSSDHPVAGSGTDRQMKGTGGNCPN